MQSNNTSVVRHTRCPRCAKEGRDRAGNNLAEYSDGHSYCFACHYYGHPPNSLKRMQKRLYQFKESTDERYADLDTLCTSYDLPPRVLSWLRRYHITDAEIRLHNFGWNESKSSLVMPVLDGERIVHVTYRYFGDNPDHPKYVTRGYKHNHFKHIFPPERSNIWVLCEDYISAIRVGRQVNSIPVFGSIAPHDLILRLASYKPTLRFWLDRDKAIEAIKQAARARQWISDCATIVTEKDPKEYTDAEIKHILGSNL